MKLFFADFLCERQTSESLSHKKLATKLFSQNEILFFIKIIFAKKYFYKNKFRVKKFFPLLHFAENLFSEIIPQKMQVFWVFHSIVLPSEIDKNSKNRPEAKIPHILRKWPILSKKWGFFRFGPIAENAKNPKNGKKQPKMGFWISGRDGPKRQAAARVCGLPNMWSVAPCWNAHKSCQNTILRKVVKSWNVW